MFEITLIEGRLQVKQLKQLVTIYQYNSLMDNDRVLIPHEILLC